MSRNPRMLLGLLILIGIVLVLGFGMNSGYGEVSSETYEYSKAIYSACLNKNKEHLCKVEALISNCEELPAHERKWLEHIIAQAHGNNWESASGDARRMMEDQVKY